MIRRRTGRANALCLSLVLLACTVVLTGAVTVLVAFVNLVKWGLTCL